MSTLPLYCFLITMSLQDKPHINSQRALALLEDHQRVDVELDDLGEVADELAETEDHVNDGVQVAGIRRCNGFRSAGMTWRDMVESLSSVPG